MTRRTRKLAPKRIASNEFLLKYSRVVGLIERLQAAQEEHFNADPDSITWGDVGSINEVVQRLESLVDFVEGR